MTYGENFRPTKIKPKLSEDDWPSDKTLLEARLRGLKVLRDDLQIALDRTITYEECLSLGADSINSFQKQIRRIISKLSLIIQECESRISGKYE